ncbi:MAG: hypothetical protein QF922_00625, partial [SAR324 cluster bacterium]|nr:hypothetical protein [SAR324 cluster bacterium]
MIPGLSEANIRKQAGEGSFERGRDYYSNGAVLSLTQRGQVIHFQKIRLGDGLKDEQRLFRRVPCQEFSSLLQQFPESIRGMVFFP